MQINNNQLYLGGISASDLARKFGTPLYVYEEDTIRQRYRQFTENIKYNKLRIFFACKSNTNLGILKILKSEGCYIDAVSPGEVFAALRVGFRPEQIMFTGSNVTDEEMVFLISKKILINMDSLSQMERYGKLNPGSRISVRINPDVGAGHHDHCITGGPESKFGIYFDKADEIKRIAEKYKLKIIGLHQHIGSGILDSEKYLYAMNVLLKVATEFKELEFVDFGGGIGVPYKPGEKPIDLKEFGEKAVSLFTDFCESYGRELVLAFEPGRFLVAESGVLLCRVNTIKETPNHRLMGVDSGFNHLIRPMAYGSYHEIVVVDKVNSDEKEAVAVAGNLCESGDVFTRSEEGIVDRDLPRLKEGDVLAILNAGAYGYSMASNYNMRPRPREVIVKNGEARIVREAEKFDDLLRNCYE